MNLNKITLDKDDLGYIMLFIALLVFFIIVSITYRNRSKSLNENSKYAIGITKEIIRPYNGRDYILYEFEVNGKTYSGSLLDIRNIQVPLGRYKVKYDSENPNNNQMLKSYKVKDSIFQIPLNGWKQLPMKIVDTSRY